MRRSLGVGLFDALIALAILSFGLLAMTRFQGRVVTQATEAQSRQTAVQLGDELLNTALVDVGNAACYTLPAAGPCSSADARATLGVAGRLTVAIEWRGQESRETRNLAAVTDVRP